MAKKKAVGNGAGTVYPRRNKEGKITGYLGSYFDQAGKRRYVSAKHKNDCRTRLRKAMSDADQGIVFDVQGQTVGQWLGMWLEDVVKPNKTHRTYATHRQQINGHVVVPALGQVKLEALRKAHVDRLYANLLRPKPEGGAGLALSSVRRVHAVLHAALEEAVRGDLIPRNPAAHANKPKVRQQEIEPLDADQAAKLLDAARKRSKFEALYALCLLCALRQGEALGLKWSDIDLDARSPTLRVNRQLQRVRGEDGKPGRLEFSEPKNASRRAVGLPTRTVGALRRHAERQAGEIEAAGDGYDHAGLVFANLTGVPSTPRTSSTATSSRCSRAPASPPSASTTSGTRAFRSWPSAASPSATCRPWPATRRPPSPCRGTPTTTILRPAAPPGRWTRPSAEPYC